MWILSLLCWVYVTAIAAVAYIWQNDIRKRPMLKAFVSYSCVGAALCGAASILAFLIQEVL